MRNNIKLLMGLNLSHDSSLSIHDEKGRLLFAAQEERYTRVKNDERFPYLTLKSAIESLEIDKSVEISKVVIGSHGARHLGQFALWYELFNPPMLEGVMNWRNLAHKVVPGHHSKLKSVEMRFNNLENYIHSSISMILQNENLNWSGDLSFVPHHDAHAASGIVGSGYQTCLGISLDGSGDSESGVVQKYENGKVLDLLRIPETNSLGIVYSEVTKRYGFTPNKHEGKITGLAALGETGPAVTYLFNNIKVINGEPQFMIESRKIHWLMNRVLARMKLAGKVPSSIERLIEEATSLSINYPDLAFAIQNVIETRILEIVNFWISKTGLSDVSLSGGVFSNVKFNQIIAEQSKASRVFVFPCMGDAGLSAGGVWRDLINRGELDSITKFNDMYLGSASKETLSIFPNNELINTIDGPQDTIDFLVELLISGKTIGTCIGRMEYGPRALGNRSILAAATDSSINQELNKKLNRTEFMPFPPIVLDTFAFEVFDLTQIKDIRPFDYMTMTCQVLNNWRDRVPAIVHVDGSARPQIMKRSYSSKVYELLVRYEKKTGIPLLINTSFNVHEEPIVENIDSALNALVSGRIEAVWDGERVFVKQ